MGIAFSPPSESESAPVFSAIIECSTFHAHLAPALFDLFRREARMCGFDDMDTISVSIKLEVSGSNTTERDFGALYERIDSLWVGAHTYAAQRAKR